MLTPYDLKKYIIENNKLIEILEIIGCHGIKEYKDQYRCGLPNSKDTTKVRIYKDSLKVKVYFASVLFGDIFTLYMQVKDLSFVEANKEIHKILKLKFIWKKEKPKKSPLDIFYSVAQNKFDIKEIEIYNEDILVDFMPYVHINWVNEGIMPYTAKVFNIGFSIKHNRIIIPHRYWCGDEMDYLGIVGRTIEEHYERLKIPKYLAIKQFSKSMNLYGLQENYAGIQEAGYVVVAEAEKSVLKRHSLLDYTVVAMCGSSLSTEQVKILLGLDVEIILAFDKGIEKEHILFECDKLVKFRKTSYIWDENNDLENKESPMDKCNNVYNTLLKNRIRR